MFNLHNIHFPKFNLCGSLIKQLVNLQHNYLGMYDMVKVVDHSALACSNVDPVPYYTHAYVYKASMYIRTYCKRESGTYILCMELRWLLVVSLL